MSAVSSVKVTSFIILLLTAVYLCYLLGFLTSDVPLHTAWFHGDALRLEEERILEVVQYRCCKCRRRAMPICPHSDDYKKPGPEFSEQTVATSSQSSMLSSEETASVADQDPLLASYGIVEPIGA